jgi:hypothetical protein
LDIKKTGMTLQGMNRKIGQPLADLVPVCVVKTKNPRCHQTVMDFG